VKKANEEMQEPIATNHLRIWILFEGMEPLRSLFSQRSSLPFFFF